CGVAEHRQRRVPVWARTSPFGSLSRRGAWRDVRIEHASRGGMAAPSETEPGQPDPGLSALMSERRQLINLAYRLLGALADAEDVVQETYARWYAMSPEQQEAIETPAAWLMKVASRICLDVLRSARARRERYVGEWLPEPLPENT